LAGSRDEAYRAGITMATRMDGLRAGKGTD
jgi:hypothetical protein